MGATSSASSTSTEDYERPAVGVYPARCIQVVELGTHMREWKGEPKEAKEILIVWELSNELMQDGRPFVVSWKGTNSLSDRANLYKMLVSWRGQAFTEEQLECFEMKNILDKQCMVNLVAVKTKKGKEFITVSTVMPLPKGMNCAERVNELVDFGIGDYLKPEYNKLYPWVQNIVKESIEVKSGALGALPEEHHSEPDDDIPF
jgi:hypothetical protein